MIVTEPLDPHAEAPPDDFTREVDPDGLVIYFGIAGRRYLFNGASGEFFNHLPPYAVECLNLVTTQRDPAIVALGIARIRERFAQATDAPDCARWLAALPALARGEHPDLAPEPPQRGFLKEMTPHLLNIYVSQGCNLACTYCFNQGGTFGGHARVMKPETAKDTLDFILGLARRGNLPDLGINLFGGEPLLAPEAVRILARGVLEHNRTDARTKIRVMLSTNGTIYHEDIFDLFRQDPAHATVVISLDGTREAHDANRPFASRKGGSSWDAALANVRRIVEAGVPHSVTCVVTLPFDFVGMAKQLQAIGVERLEIKHLNQHIQGQPMLPAVFRRNFETWRQHYIEYGDFHLDYMENGGATAHVDRYYKFKDFARHLSGQGFHRVVACGVADDKIGIAADGRLFPCEAFLGHAEFEFGHVRTGFDAEKYRAFQDRLLEAGQHRTEHPKCKTCFAKKVCGGGCYAEAYDATGTFKKIDPESCRYIRETMKIDLHYLSEAQARNPARFARLTTD